MKEIELTQGKVALVDDEDYEMVNEFKWYVQKAQKTDNGLVRWYAKRNIRLINGKQTALLLHRLILQNFDMRFQVDHIDGNGLNNQKSNLRLCNNCENIRNRRKQNGTSSKYKGVSCYKKIKHGKVVGIYICSEIRFNGKKFRIGQYKTEEEAALAYNEAAKKMFGRFAKLNEVV